MIRIDEIYLATFYSYLKRTSPHTRLFFCDPPGRSDPDALYNFGDDNIQETQYVFMHDQEPINITLHKPLFEEVFRRNRDLYPDLGPRKYPGRVIVSELGENLDQLCREFRWRPHYYFYHGWACLDWFRGYDQTYLITPADLRQPQRTFISPNRIVGGERDHRVIFLYLIYKNQLEHNYISAPRICPQENVLIEDAASHYINTYPDISQVLKDADLPRTFEGETTQLMTSYQLSNFKEAEDSVLYLVTETIYFGRRLHLTEKTFKPIALAMPFMLVAPAGSLRYLRSYGFKTFAGIIDETYDEETDDLRRLELIIQEIKRIDSMTRAEKIELYRACLPVVEHNYDHFYRGGFKDRLIPELNSVLGEMIV